MILVEKVHELQSLSSSVAEFQKGTLTLPWEERCQGHGKRSSDQGVEFAISLPHGTVLKENDCLVLESKRLVICIKEAEESVYLILPETPQEWAYYAYQIGNRHQPLMIGDQELICLANPATQSLLEQLNIAYQPDTRPFNSARIMVGHSH